MPAYYFSLEGIKTGERSDPATDKLVSIQYQKIDLSTAEPLDVLVILREWESSEQEIVTTFYNQFFKPGVSVTLFIPVGLNLDYAYEMLLALCRKYRLSPPTSHELYFRRLRFDLRPILVLLNNGRFGGATLDAFSLKKTEDRHMEKWYEKKEFGRIEHYVREDAARFLKVLQYLSKYKSRLGITLKETPASRKTPRKQPVDENEEPVSTLPSPATRIRPVNRAPDTEKQAGQYRTAPDLSTRSVATMDRPVHRAADDGKQGQHNRPAPKVTSRTLLPAPERSQDQRKRAPAGRNQLARFPSGKDAPVRKGERKRRQD